MSENSKITSPQQGLIVADAETVLERWRKSKNWKRAMGSSFPAFHRRLLQLLPIQEGPGHRIAALHLLPPSAIQVGREAEKSKEFLQLTADLFGLSIEESSYRAERLAKVVRRSGYYQAVLTREPPEQYWQTIAERIPIFNREIRHLGMLAGCVFPRARFPLAGYSVVRISRKEIENLGASPRVCDDFYHEERLDPSLAFYWFLEYTHPAPDGCVELSEALNPQARTTHRGIPKSEPPPFVETEIAAGVSRIQRTNVSKGRSKSKSITLSKDLEPLLILALYSDRFFEVPVVFRCEPGWWIKTIRSEPYWRQKTYRIVRSNWGKFEKFAGVCEAALAPSFRNYAAKLGDQPQSASWRPLVTAMNHYLRATFTLGEEPPSWVQDELFLSIFGPSLTTMIEQSKSNRAAPTHASRAAEEDILLRYVFFWRRF